MKFKVTVLLTILISYVGSGQISDYCPMGDNLNNQIVQKSQICTQISPDFINSYGLYSYYKDIYDLRNEIIIPIDIHV